MTKKFISHRGNLIGPFPDLENRPEYIENAINSGFDCECDVWRIGDKWWLGHDEPQYRIELDFLLDNSEKLWIHTKNFEALDALVAEGLNCFFHADDPYTLTSKGYIWAYPGSRINFNTICVMPETVGPVIYTQNDKNNALGICSDYIVLEKLEQIRRNT